MHLYQKIAAYISKQHSTSPLLVGIDGHSAAGKSTLTRALRQHLPHTTIIHGDDFYRVMDAHKRAALDAAGGYALYYDWQRLGQQVLIPLSQGRTARYQRYDWINNCLGDWAEVAPEGMILVEGVYMLRPELRAYFDVTIFVETSFATRMRRQRERTDPHEWVARWDQAEQHYLQRHTPHLYADIVVRDNTHVTFARPTIR